RAVSQTQGAGGTRAACADRRDRQGTAARCQGRRQGKAGEAAGECGGGPAQDEPTCEGLAALETQPRSEGAELSDSPFWAAGSRGGGSRQATGRGVGRDDSAGVAAEPWPGGVWRGSVDAGGQEVAGAAVA